MRLPNGAVLTYDVYTVASVPTQWIQMRDANRTDGNQCTYTGTFYVDGYIRGQAACLNATVNWTARYK
jgi:hypothetical protein